MNQNKFGELVFSENDVCNLLMQGRDIDSLTHMVIDNTINLEELAMHIERPDSLLTWTFPYNQGLSVPEFHASQQMTWHMPEEYKQLDIAQWVLEQCNNDAELQRAGAELLEYAQRNLLDMLCYLKYLVDTMQTNNIVWGVGRGSSVASFVLYKIGVHRIDSLYYDLDFHEFMR